MVFVSSLFSLLESTIKCATCVAIVRNWILPCHVECVPLLPFPSSNKSLIISSACPLSTFVCSFFFLLCATPVGKDGVGSIRTLRLRKGSLHEKAGAFIARSVNRNKPEWRASRIGGGFSSRRLRAGPNCFAGGRSGVAEFAEAEEDKKEFGYGSDGMTPYRLDVQPPPNDSTNLLVYYHFLWICRL